MKTNVLAQNEARLLSINLLLAYLKKCKLWWGKINRTSSFLLFCHENGRRWWILPSTTARSWIACCLNVGLPLLLTVSQTSSLFHFFCNHMAKRCCWCPAIAAVLLMELNPPGWFCSHVWIWTPLVVMKFNWWEQHHLLMHHDWVLELWKAWSRLRAFVLMA